MTHQEKMVEIAAVRHKEPMSTWPDHTAEHRRTLNGNFMEDMDCLRCNLETAAAVEAVSNRIVPAEGKKAAIVSKLPGICRLSRVRELWRSGGLRQPEWRAGTLFFISLKEVVVWFKDMDKETAEEICELISAEMSLTES